MTPRERTPIVIAGLAAAIAILGGCGGDDVRYSDKRIIDKLNLEKSDNGYSVEGDVFCEVKTRRGSRAGAGFEAVDGRKRRKLRALAEVFLLTHASAPVAVRFDVASVAIGAGERPGGTQVELFEDAF